MLEPYEFEFSEMGRVYLPISVKPLDEMALKMERVLFKVDTGADFTTISKVTLARLGFNANWIKQRNYPLTYGIECCKIAP